jgi:hypothetical protein
MTRALWYDELFTYYIAQKPTVEQVVETAARTDLNPPLEYLVARFSTKLLGADAFGLRLPSAVAFYAASILLFFYIRRKAGDAYACFGLAVLWFSDVLYYASEARPYALVLFFFCLLLLCWDTAVTTKRRTAALWGVALANAGMLLSHVFAPLSLLPFFAAEAVRLYQRRKPDYPLWAALVLPTPIMVLYVPLFRTFASILHPLMYQASPLKLAKFYVHGLREAILGLLVVLAVAAVAHVRARKQTAGLRSDDRERRVRSGIQTADYALFGLLVLNPVVVTLAIMRSHSAFWPRYCLTTYIALFAALAIFLALRLRAESAAAYTSVLVMVLVSSITNTILPALRAGAPPDSVERIRPDLPLVAASGMQFLEMDYYGSGAFTSRLYYLKDRASAIYYTHGTLNEDYGPDKLRRDFPIRGNVQSYSTFVSQHREFLVLGTWNLDWLLQKLHDDGASTQLIGELNVPYRDKKLYLVTMREPGT